MLTPLFKICLVRTGLPVPSPDPKPSSGHLTPIFVDPVATLNLTEDTQLRKEVNIPGYITKT